MRDAVDSLSLARTLVDYNEWANERILATADRVPDEAFHRPLAGAGHGSIFGQLRHIAYVQLGYLAGFEGRAIDAASGAAAVAGLRSGPRVTRGRGGRVPARPPRLARAGRRAHRGALERAPAPMAGQSYRWESTCSRC